MKNLKFIFLLFFIWRIFLFLPLYFGYLFLPYRQGDLYTNLWKFTKSYFPVDNFLIFPWANFDGVHYLSIAGEGYNANGRFFPLFPLIIRGVSQLFGTGHAFGLIQFFSGFLVANISFFLAIIIFYKLVKLDFSNKVATFSIIFLLLFPASFYFVSIYSESLFLLLSLLVFYFVRRKKWPLAIFFGILLTSTRIIGIAILPVLIYEFIKEGKIIGIKNIVLRTLPLVFVSFGLVSYMIFNFLRWGNALYFFNSQGMLGNSRSVSSIVFPVQTLFRYSKIFKNIPINQFEWWLALLEILVFILVSILLFIAWKKKIRKSYILYSILCFLIPSLSGTFSGIPRYSVVLFPIFITLALIKNNKIKIIYSVVSLALLFILLMFFARGYYIA